MKKIILATFLSLALFAAKPAYAEEVCVEVQVYGGGVGVVCGTKTHEPVPADIAGISPLTIGAGLVMASGALVYLSRKFSRR
jgi:hypothetical protein